MVYHAFYEAKFKKEDFWHKFQLRLSFCCGVYFLRCGVSCWFMLDEKDKELSAAASYLNIIFC